MYKIVLQPQLNSSRPSKLHNSRFERGSLSKSTCNWDFSTVTIPNATAQKVVLTTVIPLCEPSKGPIAVLRLSYHTPPSQLWHPAEAGFVLSRITQVTGPVHKVTFGSATKSASRPSSSSSSCSSCSSSSSPQDDVYRAGHSIVSLSALLICSIICDMPLQTMKSPGHYCQ